MTPEIQILAAILYATEGGNWQRGGGSGPQPKPMKLPEDRKTSDDLDANELARRRAELKRRREKA